MNVTDRGETALDLLRELWRHRAAGDLRFLVEANGAEVDALVLRVKDFLASLAPTKEKP